MAMFATKVWSFKEPYHPLLFSGENIRDKAQKSLKDEDWVVVVGVLNNNAAPEDKGRVLGLLKPTRIPVNTADYIPTKEPLNAKGRYKWPFALALSKAWRLPEKPLLTEITNQEFNHRVLAKELVQLDKQAESKILNLKREKVKIAPPKNLYADNFDYEKEIAKITTPPPPTDKEQKITINMNRGPTYTYCMEIIGSKDTFKIGWANEFKKREKTFNRFALPDLGGLKYQTKLKHRWDTARQAYKMEQAILEKFKKHRHSKNQEVVSAPFSAIKKAWEETISEIKK